MAVAKGPPDEVSEGVSCEIMIIVKMKCIGIEEYIQTTKFVR